MSVIEKPVVASIDTYAKYQECVTHNHLIPLFQSLALTLDKPILDVGCGKGGCALALASTFSVPVVGVDLRTDEIALANQLAQSAGVSATFHYRDILSDELPGDSFGLILMRDVIEHVVDQEMALARLRKKMTSQGALYISFPPWRGPYAGHQHNAKSLVRFMPYLHCAHPSLFLWLLHYLEPERQDWLEDMRQIALNRLSMKKFEGHVLNSGFTIKYKKTYFFRPAFMRMGLPKIPNGWVGNIPWIGECLTTGCEYLLTPC